jgi:diguanylate cyclase (GGDEF)-like protein
MSTGAADIQSMTLRSKVAVPAASAVRIAVAGMSLAVVALGALAVWSAYVTQRESDDLTSVGVQTTGQLRAVQALSAMRIELRALEDDGVTEDRLSRLRAAQQMLPGALARMKAGDAAEPARVAGLAEPLARQLDPAVHAYITDPTGDILYKGEDDDDTTEDALEDIMQGLEVLLNDSGSDPADLLGTKLENVSSVGAAVRRTALVLVPLGLLGVGTCAWLLRIYRRRSEAAMQQALEMSAREARTDQLTGLPNRRALIEELQGRIERGQAFTIALADLNGFKHYNDTFGHPAGDALLRRLGHKLAAAWEGHGFAARLGGDEFCVLADGLRPERLQAILHEALSEEGEGFHIGTVSGLAAVPADANEASTALRIADTALYAEKAALYAGRRSNRRDATQPPLPQLLSQRLPDLGSHLDRVAALAAACAHHIGLPADQIRSIERAAQLHDIGKAAVPAAILDKRGDLTDEEQQFVRHHSTIGARLLSGDDSLDQAAAMIGAMQERWDGTGYPDQRARHSIPIGARIIAVADAFCAMTTDRPHAPARSAEEALAELYRCSGTQFDPTVVAAVAQSVDRAPTRH